MSDRIYFSDRHAFLVMAGKEALILRGEKSVQAGRPMVGSGEGQAASPGPSIKHRARSLMGRRGPCTPAQHPAPRGR